MPRLCARITPPAEGGGAPISSRPSARANRRARAHGAVVGQVVQRPDAAGRTYALDQLLCQLAAIEAVTAVAGESLQGLRQFRLAQQMTFGRKIALVEKQPRTLGIVTQCGRRQLARWRYTASTSKPSRARAMAGARSPRVAGDHVVRRARPAPLACRESPPPAGRSATVRAGTARRADTCLAWRRAAHARGRRYVTGRFGGLAQQKEATTAEPRAIGLDHGQCGAHRDGGVEGVAACFRIWRPTSLARDGRWRRHHCRAGWPGRCRPATAGRRTSRGAP